MPDDDKELQQQLAALQAAVAEMEAQRARDIEVIKAAVSPPTARERKAAANRKLRTYHDEVRDGKRARVRSGPHEEAAAKRAAEEASDDAA